MYNGIGLETARGSGTNGYVQRNLSFIRRHKDKVDYKSEEELKKLDSQLTKGPNQDILDHERKRKIELKCMEMQELMEEQGYADEEIEHKVSVFRQMLMEKAQGDNTAVVEKDDAGRPIAKATHQISEANQMRNQQLKAAFGLSEFYQDGSSMDPQRKAKEDAAKALALAQKKYALVADEDENETNVPHQSENKSKRKHKHADSESSEKKKQHHTSTDVESERKHAHKRNSVDNDEKEVDRKRRHDRSRSSSVSRKKKRLSKSRSRSADKNVQKKASRSKSSPSTSKKHGSKKHRR